MSDGVSDTPTLVGAMRVLAASIESEDGVANAAIAEAAQRLDDLARLADDLVRSVEHPRSLRGDCPGCRLVARYRRLVLAKEFW